MVPGDCFQTQDADHRSVSISAVAKTVASPTEAVAAGKLCQDALADTKQIILTSFILGLKVA